MAAPFERVLLIFGLRRNPTGYLDAGDLVPLAPEPAREAVVAAALHSLEGEGLIEIDRTRVRRIRFRRTDAGVALGERLLRDGRLSFARAIDGSRGQGGKRGRSNGENLL
jgi:DNA-binding PadR family transcriptional regulator